MDSKKMAAVKKIRFRGDSNNRIEDVIFENECYNQVNDPVERKSPSARSSSFLDFVRVEVTRGYILEHEEERFSNRREKIYSFMRIPRDLEKFMAYGVLQCGDSFLYIFTFLPIRFLLALWALVTRPVLRCLGLQRKSKILSPAEICDLLKGIIFILCCMIMLIVDTNMLYHLIKSQSIIKLYIFYNMLEVGDRLLSAFGQDTIDALFWTATEPKKSKKDHLGFIPHFCFALIYVSLHSALIMFQVTALNVAINSNSKGLLTIMMSNNFVELKGSVFKKFDKNNLFQLTCSDVRERFHLTILLLIVVIQTMKEFNWRSEQFFVMIPDCGYVMMTEFFVDWIKHAFITRFNEIPVDVYKEYTISLAYDMTQTRQKHAFSDHSDLVARRMGFIPFPLGVILVKALYHALCFENAGSIVIFVIAYLFLVSCRVLNTICTLGKACDLIKEHTEKQDEKNATNNSGPRATTSRTTTVHTATSPSHPSYHKPEIIDVSKEIKLLKTADDSPMSRKHSLGTTALFSNSDLELIDLENAKLNDSLTQENSEETEDTDVMTRSVPDLDSGGPNLMKRTHKRSESEPSIQLD